MLKAQSNDNFPNVLQRSRDCCGVSLAILCYGYCSEHCRSRAKKREKKRKFFLPGLLNFYFSLFSFCHILFDCWHSLAENREASVIDRLWIRATLACRLLGEPAVQAPALPFLNWSPQNLGAHKLRNLIGRLYWRAKRIPVRKPLAID